MNEQKPSEALYAAADHIDAFGLAKFRLHGDGDRQTAPACSIGAILLNGWGGAQVQAAAALRRYLGGESIADWNNAPERTAEEVSATMRACAVVEQAKESAAVQVSAEVVA